MVEDKELKKEIKTKKIGFVNELDNFTTQIILDKNEAPAPIYPLDQPMPIYARDENDNIFLIYEQKLIAPSTDLPSLTYLSSEGEIVLNPAKNFILQSSLSDFLGNAVLVNEKAVPALLLDVFKVEAGDLVNIWNNYGFRHLKLVSETLTSEKFKRFIRIYTYFFKNNILNNEQIRKELLRTLVEIGDKNNLNDQTDYLETLKEFMSDNAQVLILDNKMAGIKAYIKNRELKYGDLICFDEVNKQTLSVISELHEIAVLDLLFVIENNIPSLSVSPLRVGTEGSVMGVQEIVNRLYSNFDNTYVKIPIGIIPQINIPYNIVLKGNELIHFALVAISGAGKGNLLKEMIFENEKLRLRDLREQGNLGEWSRLGIILFDDVGEYVKCLKPKDWGLDLAMLAMKFCHRDETPMIHLVDVGMRIEINQDSEVPNDFRFIEPRPMKVPLEFIPLAEIMRSLEATTAAIGVIPAYLRHFYTRVHPELRPEGFNEIRLTLDFVNWFLGEPLPFNNGSRDRYGYQRTSYHTAARALREFLLNNHRYLGLRIDWIGGRDDNGNITHETFHYLESIGQFRLDSEGNSFMNGDIQMGMTLNDNYNLVRHAMQCADCGETLIIDESSLTPEVKLLIQRILLDYIVNERERRGFYPSITPCLFIIEEATALLSGKASAQIDLFNKVQVRARKFGIGIGLVLQDIIRLDPTLLTQLGWMVAMGLPVNSMRQILFRNVPSDLGPYDDFVKYADVGIAVGFQKLVGRNLPLPMKVNHFEAEVKKMLWDEEIWGEPGGFDEDAQNEFIRTANLLNIPDDVIEEILKIEVSDNE